MYSRDLSKGVLIDMLAGRKVFAAATSRYGFAPLEFSAGWIAQSLDRDGVIEVGARNSISLQKVAGHLGHRIEFEGNEDHQEITNPESSFPDANNVLKFLDSRISEEKQHVP